MKTLSKLFLTLIIVFNLTASFAADNYKFGWKSNPKHNIGLKQFVHNPKYSAQNLPDAVDLSGVMPNGVKPNPCFMPPVYDQKDIGSCTANAGTAAFEFLLRKQLNITTPLSRLGLYTCSLMHDGNWPQDAGSYTSTVVWVLKNQGEGTESCFPYSKPFGTRLPSCYLPDAKKRLVINAYDVNSTDHVSIKVALAKGYPVMYGGYVYSAIQNLNSSNYFNPPRSGRPIGGHERLIVGYDSKLTHVFNGKTYTGFYWVRNSWGTSWGYKGYSWEPASEIENPAINEDFAVIDLAKVTK